ncbi:MAG: hypothetical protein II486_01505 [Thermoguttaceae bacterium]|nr:hypothetical protein [Thermoguttaceae bacterium]
MKRALLFTLCQLLSSLFFAVPVSLITAENACSFEDDDGWKSVERAEKDKPAVLVVCPPVFESALQPWIEYRRSQGYELFLLSLAATNSDGSVDEGIQLEPVASPAEIKAKILKVAKDHDVAAVVLVGDGAPTLDAPYNWRDVVPAARVRSLTLEVFGGEDVIATDSFYGDLDDDGFADVPVGRFPVETPEELRAMVAKIIRYETSSPAGNWMRRVNLYAGPNGVDLRVIGSRQGGELGDSAPTRGISSLVDSIIDNTARKMFAQFLPQEFSVSLTQCSLRSNFCPYPPDFNDVFVQRANEGSLFLVYMGHGRVLGLDRFVAGNKDYGIFEIEDCDRLNASNHAPIAFFFACYTGAYDANCASLAERIALAPNGPVAVYAASRLSAPYGMSVLGASLLECALNDESESVEEYTLGEIILKAQKRAMTPATEMEEQEALEFNPEDVFSEDSEAKKDEEDSPKPFLTLDGESANDVSDKDKHPGEHIEMINRRLQKSLDRAKELERIRSSFRLTLERAAAIFDPTARRLDEQIRDHILEFNLFGDPLLRIHFPKRVTIELDEVVYSGTEFEVSGSLPQTDNKEYMVQAELLLSDFRSDVKMPDRKGPFEESKENEEEYRKTYLESNVFVVDAVRTTSRNGNFTAKIIPPNGFTGESVVRIAAFDGKNFYIGSKKIFVRPSVSTEQEK